MCGGIETTRSPASVFGGFSSAKRRVTTFPRALPLTLYLMRAMALSLPHACFGAMCSLAITAVVSDHAGQQTFLAITRRTRTRPAVAPDSVRRAIPVPQVLLPGPPLRGSSGTRLAA
jgi:hypothetical protein